MIHILYAIAAGMAVLAVFGYCVQTRRVNALIVESNDLLTRNVQLGQRYRKLTASSQRLIADVLELSRSSKETVISLELMTEKYKKLTGDYCTLLESEHKVIKSLCSNSIRRGVIPLDFDDPVTTETPVQKRATSILTRAVSVTETKRFLMSVARNPDNQLIDDNPSP
jgi:hypothetical protein